MASPLDSGKYLAETALALAVTGSCVVPAGALLASEMYKMQSDPGEQFDAGMAWFKVGSDLSKAISSAESINGAVGAAWRDDPGDDAAQKFGEKVADYIRELMVGMIFAYLVGIALIISAIAMFVNITIGLAMSVGLVVWAASIVATAASVVGDFGPVEAEEAAANDYALDCYNSLDELDGVMRTLDRGLAGGIAAAMALDVVTQFAMGDHDIVGDLVQASVDGIGTIASGLVAKLYQEGVAKGMKLPGAGAAIPRLIFDGIGLHDAGHDQTIGDVLTGGLV